MRKARRVATLPVKAKSSPTRKLSVAEVDLVLDELAKGRRPAEARDWLRRTTGTAVTTHLLGQYLRTHADEIAKRRQAWSDGALPQMHLRHRPARVGELIAAYALLARQCFREMCPACLGAGIVGVPSRRKDGHATSKRCADCKGRRWVVAKGADAYELGDDVGASARRLLGLAPPPDLPLPVWDRMQAVLRQIAEEVGDTKSGQGGDSAADADLRSKAAMREAYAEQVRHATPEQAIELMKSVGMAARGAIPAAGSGTEDG